MPPDFWADLVAMHAGTQGGGQQLASETHAEHRRVRLHGSIDQTQFVGQIGKLGLFVHTRRPTHHDETIETSHALRNRFSVVSLSLIHI